MNEIKIKRAIISVSDKTNLIPFVKKLTDLGIEILSTGGTAKLLKEEGFSIKTVENYTQFPEIMGGRVKTLHPKVHGGILGRKDIDDQVMQDHGILPVDLLVVNLYPFKKTIQSDDCSYQKAIENIDIGGPAMLRAGAKNHERVTVVIDPADYDLIINEISSQGVEISLTTRKVLAAKVYSHTAQYDAEVANYLSKQLNSSSNSLPDLFISAYQKKQSLRYGENPHQQAALYQSLSQTEVGVVGAKQIQGKPLSYNNIADTDAAINCVYEIDTVACTIVKHANPCGVACGESVLDAYNKAYSCDPVSAFGGIIAFNRSLDPETAKEIIKRQFVEVIIAPTIPAETAAVLVEKPNIRVLELGEGFSQSEKAMSLLRVSGGLLVQDKDIVKINHEDLSIVTEREPSSSELHDLLFAWKVVKHVKSNAIVLAKNQMTLGIGCGQTSRVHSSLIASIKAKEQSLDLVDSVMASDAFFPFRDGLDNAAKIGVKAVIQPGGSIRDQEIIDAANEYNIAMIFTGRRHFKH